ncbi:MAG: hypothetical protein EHM53_04065 [Methanoregulaceae archaeon]|nr:MAG: hypothetical protein EHM53_04065 [Methanoregulaceae archaeon]
MNPGNRGTVILVLLLAIIAAPVTAAVYFTTSAPGIITKGDTFSISGTGAVNGTVGIWIVGRDHFEVLTTAPDRHGNFSITIKPSATNRFSSGQYAIVFQDPGASGVLEIEGGTDVNDNLVVMNRGKIVTRLGHRQDLGENIRPIAGQILSSSSIPGMDDIFQVEYFFVEEPAVFFNNLIPASGFRLPDQITGERIVISGTTNIATENAISTEIRTRNTKELVTVKTIPVISGDPMNTWIWDLDAPGLPPGDYELTVGWVKSNTTVMGVFTVKYPAPPSSPSDGKPVDEKIPRQDDYTFPVLVACSLIVLAIVLYYAGRE